jgi:hypothetical protein
MLRRVVSHGLLSALMMEALNTFETSVNFYETKRRSISEDSHLHGDKPLGSIVAENF